jgi:peptide/nickel transport system permease protein
MSASQEIERVYLHRPPVYLAAWSLLRKQPLAAFGGLLVMSLFTMAIFADYLAPHDAEVISFASMLSPPDSEYLLGTDQFGRDLLSRLIYGARTALFIGCVAAGTGATAGLVIGVASAYFGGKVDLIIQRIIDVFIAFPTIIIALSIVAVFGSDLRHVVLAICLPFIPDAARIVRSNALAIREIPYVDAARALGYSHARIILRHMVPNVLAPYLIILTANIGQAILLEASLSYLGLGVQEPTPAWGLMLQGGAEEYAESAPWVAIFPGLAIAVAVFGFNLFGDGVRDALDPRLRSE